MNKNSDQSDFFCKKGKKLIDYKKYISIDPEIRFGKPCIINTRISVSDILGWLASGMSFDEIEDDFPEIKREHILAALAYCAKREHSVKTIIHGKTAV